MTQSVYNGTTSQFTYAADGLRHRSVVNGLTTDLVLDASMFVRELQGGVSNATYFVGARDPEYRRNDTTGTVSWYLFDGLGSVLAEVNPTGIITSSRSYDVYGNVRSGVNANGTSAHKFVGNLGHPSDNNTGLIYMQARYMDPATGRFVSEDPGRQHANWLVYASSNPVCRADRSGRDDDNLGELMESMSLDLGLGCLEESCGLSELNGTLVWNTDNELVAFIEEIASVGGQGSATFNKAAFLSILWQIAQEYECSAISIGGETAGSLSGGAKMFAAFSGIVGTLVGTGQLCTENDITTVYWLLQ